MKQTVATMGSQFRVSSIRRKKILSVKDIHGASRNGTHVLGLDHQKPLTRQKCASARRSETYGHLRQPNHMNHVHSAHGFLSTLQSYPEMYSYTAVLVLWWPLTKGSRCLYIGHIFGGQLNLRPTYDYG